MPGAWLTFVLIVGLMLYALWQLVSLMRGGRKTVHEWASAHGLEIEALAVQPFGPIQMTYTRGGWRIFYRGTFRDRECATRSGWVRVMADSWLPAPYRVDVRWDGDS